MVRQRSARAAAALATVLLAGCAAAGAADDVQTATIGATSLQLYTFQPGGCTVSAILLVFHGVDRNPKTYRDDAIPLAQRYCMFVVAPLFDEQRFPNWRYQHGGVVNGGALQPEASWTVAFVPGLADWARAKLGRPDLPYALIGHSAGAQFLSRVAAYGPAGATHLVIANPSTWVRARLDVAAPYGFQGVFSPAGGEAALRRYLALPVTVLLGGADTGSKNLATAEEAEEQGSTRLQRGETVFAEAQQAARQRGWAFNWQIATVPGVGHNARQMFASDAAFAALHP